jgi:hypothetical protein
MSKLYNFLESGQIDYETSKVKYHFRIEKCKVIATTNSLDRLSKREHIQTFILGYLSCGHYFFVYEILKSRSNHLSDSASQLSSTHSFLSDNNISTYLPRLLI